MSLFPHIKWLSTLLCLWGKCLRHGLPLFILNFPKKEMRSLVSTNMKQFFIYFRVCLYLPQFGLVEMDNPHAPDHLKWTDSFEWVGFVFRDWDRWANSLKWTYLKSLNRLVQSQTFWDLDLMAFSFRDRPDHV